MSKEIFLILLILLAVVYYIETSYFGLIGRFFYGDRPAVEIDYPIILSFRSPWVRYRPVGRAGEGVTKKIITGKYCPVAVSEQRVYLYKTVFSYAQSIDFADISSVRAVSRLDKLGYEITALSPVDGNIYVLEICFYASDDRKRKAFSKIVLNSVAC